MSLDVYLKDPTSTYSAEYLYSANITHNLGEMAQQAGIYEALWRPHRLIKGYDISENSSDAEYEFESSSTIIAEDIIEVIENGLNKLKQNPKFYKKFDSTNGWGIYDNFIPFVEEYLNALKEYPKAIVGVDR